MHLAYLVAEMAYLRCSFQPSSIAKYKILVLSKGKRFEREIEAGAGGLLLSRKNLLEASLSVKPFISHLTLSWPFSLTGSFFDQV